MSRRVQVTIVSREAGQIVDEVIDDVLNSIFFRKQNKTMEVQCQSIFDQIKSKVEHTYSDSYDIHRARCYQQHVGNFCGYHASFAQVCVLQILEKISNPYNLTNGTSFWTFKKRIEQFLFQYRKQFKMNKTVWPWKDNDILNGDFERTYNHLFKNHNHIFLDFTTNHYFQLIQHTWEFQFKNLICDFNSRKELGDKINRFVKYKKQKPLVFVMMLAITNHWTCFIAIKVKNKTQFWFIDSKNRDYLDFSVAEIAVFIHAMNQNRKKEGLNPWLPYQTQIFEQAMIDTQLSLRLIVQFLKGQQNIHDYHHNRVFQIFSQKYQIFMNLPLETYTSNLVTWATEYKHNLRGFFKNKVDQQSLYQPNQIIYKHMTSNIIKNQSKSMDLGILANYINSSGNL